MLEGDLSFWFGLRLSFKIWQAWMKSSPGTSNNKMLKDFYFLCLWSWLERLCDNRQWYPGLRFTFQRQQLSYIYIYKNHFNLIKSMEKKKTIHYVTNVYKMFVARNLNRTYTCDQWTQSRQVAMVTSNIKSIDFVSAVLLW